MVRPAVCMILNRTFSWALWDVSKLPVLRGLCVSAVLEAARIAATAAKIRTNKEVGERPLQQSEGCGVLSVCVTRSASVQSKGERG